MASAFGQLPLGWAILLILLCLAAFFLSLAYLLYHFYWPKADKIQPSRFLSAERVKELPSLSYEEAGQLGLIPNPAGSCLICSQGLVFSDRLKALACQHVYHEQCIEGWCRRYIVCPSCQSIKSNDSETQLQ